MTSETRTIPLSKGNIVDTISAFLYASGALLDNEDVISIEFGNMNGDLVPLKVKIKKRLEVQLIEYNG